MGDFVHGVIKVDNYSIPRRSSNYADANEEEESNYDNGKSLERSAELSNLGPGTSSRAGRRPFAPRRTNSVWCREEHVGLSEGNLLSLK